MLVVAAGLAAFATPALADFFIVQDSGTKRCSIVEQWLTGQTSVIVAGLHVAEGSGGCLEDRQRSAKAAEQLADLRSHPLYSSLKANEP
jgi:hypothetical protein